jgi:hypothetical protein
VVASCWRMCTCWGGVFIEVHDLCAQCNSVCVHGKHSTQCNRSQPNKTIFPWVFSLFSYPYVLCEHDRYKYIACSPPPKWKAAAMKAIPPPCRPICNNLIFSLLDPTINFPRQIFCPVYLLFGLVATHGNGSLRTC